MDSAYHLWVNGEDIGYSQGSRNAAEFDIHNVIRKNANNTIRVKVYQWSDGSYLEDQDMWVCRSQSSCFLLGTQSESSDSTLCLENGMLTPVFSLVAVRSVHLDTFLGLSDSIL